MRILIPTTEYPPQPGGVATVTLEQARGLAALGEDVRVEAIHAAAETTVRETEHLEVHRARVRSRAIARLLPLTLNLRRAVRAWRPDFIHCTTYRGYGLPVAVVSRMTGVRYSLYMHGTEIRTELRSGLRRTILRRVLGRAAFVLANSETTCRLVRESFPGLSTPVSTLSPGVDPSRFAGESVEKRGREMRAGWLRAMGIADRPGPAPVVMLAACRMTMQKGLDYVLRAMGRLREETESVRPVFVAAGDGPDLGRYRAMATELGLEGRVLFLGAVDYETLPAAYCASDLYVQPSQLVNDVHESFGISYLEAQAAGRPCIGTDVGGVREALNPDQSGILLPPGELEPLLHSIRLLAASPGLRESMGSAGRDFARTRSWAAHCSRLRDEIISALGGRPSE